ncbi:MAG: site-specific integrase [Planctomycetaceae bacterium]
MAKAPQSDGKPKQNRRGKGEGSIFQRSDGRWTATIEVGQDQNGKRIRKSIYGETKKEVATKLTKLANQKIDGGMTDSGRMTLGEFLDRWLEDKVRLEVAPTTYGRYKSLVNLHIKPRLSKVKLSVLSTIHVQSLISSLEKAEIGQETRRYVHQVLRTAFNVAVDWDLIGRNPCDKMAVPKVIRREIAPLEGEQCQALLTASLTHRLHALFVLAIAAGMRQGELFGLQRDDIDLQTGVVTVRHSLEEIAGKLRLKSPKSKSGRRQITLPPIAIAALQSYQDLHAIEGEAFFTDTEGKFLRKSNFERRVWKPIRKAAGIPESVTFHDLRHTSASMLIRANVHAKVIQERLGHSTIKLTMDTYGHLMAGMQNEAAGHLQAALEKPVSKIGCQ